MPLSTLPPSVPERIPPPRAPTMEDAMPITRPTRPESGSVPLPREATPEVMTLKGLEETALVSGVGVVAVGRTCRTGVCWSGWRLSGG